MEQFFKNLFYRVSMETPKLFIQIRTICASIAIVCTTLLENGIDFEIYGFSITKVLAIVTAFSMIITFLFIKDKKELTEKLNKKVEY